MQQLENDKLTAIQRWAGGSKRWLEAFLAGVPSFPQMVAVVAIGSAVRDCGHPRSDFDLLIIYRGIRPAIKPPMEVDIRYASTKHLSGLVTNGNEIICWALKFGAALYDPQDCWQHLQDLWKGKIPLPSATAARKRAIQSLKCAKEMVELGDDSAADDLVLAALTQFARERLLKNEVFPASRPELPNQLRALNRDDSLAPLLESAMFGDLSAMNMLIRLNEIRP